MRMIHHAKRIVLLLVCPLLLWAQDRKISGVVRDVSGQPVPGATIQVKNSDKATRADDQGRFELTTGPGSVLVISSINFEKAELRVGDQTSIGIVLTSQQNSLENVVVIGYGTQKKANLTGAVSTVSGKQLEDRPVTNTVAALQGTAPGLVITRSSGQPGAEGYDLNIRGASSVNGSNSPLVVIDGVEGDLSLLNPNDIESISVLKDAAAASIFGAKAADGVIIVTTKKGTSGKTVLSYSGIYSVNHAFSIPERLHSWEEAELSNEARLNAGQTPLWTQEQIDMMRDPNVNYIINPANPNAYQYFYDIDQIGLLMRRNTSSQNHNLAVRGGNEKTQYLFSFGYFDQNGVFKFGPDGTSRYNARANITTKFNNIFSLDSRIQFSQGKTMAPSSSANGDYGLFYNIYQQRTLNPIFLPESGDTKYASGANAATYATLKDGGYNERIQRNMDAVFTLKAENIIRGLSLRMIYNPRLNSDNTDIFARQIPLYDLRATPASFINNPNSITKRRVTTFSHNVQALADYDWKIGKKNRFHLLGGYQYQYYNYDYISSQARVLVSNDVPSLNFGSNPTVPPIVGDNIQTNAWVSVFGRLNYTFDDKYIFEANLRRDGSSKLAPGYRYKTFPSFSAGWKLDRESWFENALPFFSEFKLRGSWGRLGNSNVLGNYDYIARLVNGPTYPFNNVANLSLYQRDLASPEKAWETITTTNIGLDFGILKNRLTGSFDYFVRKNEDMLVQVTLPALLGVTPSATNSASLKSWGWEAALNWKDKIGQFSYYVSANIADNQNEVISYSGRNVIGEGMNSIIEGHPLNSIYGFRSLGYFQDAEDVTKSAFQDNRSGAGDIKYADLDGSGRIDGGLFRPDNHGDLVYMGNTTPRYTFGSTIGAEYKGFDFSMFLQGVSGRNMLIYARAVLPLTESWRQPWEVNKDYWTPENTDARFPRMYMGGTHNTRVSSHWVQNAAYIRLKNLQIGYTLPAAITQRAKISKARFYFSGQDIWESSKMWYKYYDPENPNNASFNYPFFRSYAVGLNLTF